MKYNKVGHVGAGNVGKRSNGLSVTQIVIDHDILYSIQNFAH